MSTLVKSPFIIIGPVINYFISILLWLGISIGSGLLIVWYFMGSPSKEMPKSFVSYQKPLSAVSEAPENPVATTVVCEKHINELLQTQTVNFQTGSARLAAQGNHVVEKIAELLLPCPNSTIIINGHTDNVGPAQKNMSLSIRRAKSVVEELAQMGFSASRFTINGVGELEPIADNNTAEGRYRNRRIEVRLSE